MKPDSPLRPLVHPIPGGRKPLPASPLVVPGGTKAEDQEETPPEGTPEPSGEDSAGDSQKPRGSKSKTKSSDK